MSNKIISLPVLKKLSVIEILALISSAAVLRRYKMLKELLMISKERKINVKKIYEVLLQTYLFAGFPSVLISLQVFKEFYTKPLDEQVRGKNFYDIGVITARKIYGNKFEKLKDNIKALSPEISRWFIEEGYGKILSRGILTLKERELCIVSILSALKFENQLYSHINGAYRQKAKVHEIKKIIDNLVFIGNKQSSAFGLKVLSRFIKQKK